MIDISKWFDYDEIMGDNQQNKTTMSEDKFEWTDESVFDFFQDEYMVRNGQQAWALMDSIKEWKNKKSKQQKQKDWEIVERVPKTSNVNSLLIGGDDAYEIKKVKRLSDNSVWSVGDEVHDGIIKSFEINAQWTDGIGAWFNNSDATTLSLLRKKEKQVLFKTEDGKDIYAGDEYWVVWDIQHHIKNNSNLKASKQIATDKPLLKDSKCFSTEEAANTYVLIHKPCISMKDIHETMYADFHTRNMDDVYAKLKLLAQQRL